jgi:hypothetical protein
MPRNDLKAYTTVLARIPQDLADAVKQYASVHRCTVSELIRDGLEMRLEADIPGRSTGHPGETGEHEDEVLHEVLPQYVSRKQGQQEGHTALPQPDTHGMPSVLPLEASPPGHDKEGHTEVLPHQAPGHARAQKGITEVLHLPGSVDHVGYDPTRFYLGKLCPRGHDYQGTGKSLLRRSNQRCWECDKAMKRAIKARQKALRQEGSL